MREKLTDGRAVFEVVGFTPPDPSIDNGGWGFEVKLRLDFARRCATSFFRTERAFK